jgi:F-BAR domain only protein
VPTPRKAGTVRGRRDVRNTIFVPSNATPDMVLAPQEQNLAPSPSLVQRTEDRAADAQSIRSSHSLSSLSAGNVLRHPDMTQPGLNASIIETISTSFEAGVATKALVIGELALVHNGDKPATGKENIRLENFPVLHKVAPNPLFVSQIPDRNGEYALDLNQLSKAQVAFKYQVHLEDNALAAYSPVVLTPNWKIEATQASVILNYSWNPSLHSSNAKINLQNVVVIINIENAKALSCQSKPVGTFSKERNLIYWKLGDLTLEKDNESGQRLLARFATDGEAKPGIVEARWEISGEHVQGLGSELGVSITNGDKAQGTDSPNPFSDEDTTPNPVHSSGNVSITRKLISGKYTAN